jgi:taurine dioxygenase
LFVNPTFTNFIEGFSLEESRSILDLLYTHSIAPERTVRWHWFASCHALADGDVRRKEGDIAVWDNRESAHYGQSVRLFAC